jgi:hypothetical protein
VDRPEARRFTLILWGVITLPLLFAGFVAMVVTGAKMGQIQRDARAEMRARQEGSRERRMQASKELGEIEE